MKLIKPFLIVAILAIVAPSFAQYFVSAFKTDVSKVGTSAVPFLTIGVGARANAMGGAFVSVANDVTALYWNPAGLAALKSNQIALVHSEWIADLRHDFIGVGLSMAGLGVLGVSLNALTMDDIIVRTPELPEGTGERAGSYDLALGLSYARSLTDRLSLGGSVKYIKSQLWHMSAATVAFDCGVMFSNIFEIFQLGASISNVGGKMKYNGRDTFVYHDIRPTEYGNNEKIDADLKTNAFNLPVCFRAGISSTFNKKGMFPLLLAVEFYEPSDNVRSVNIGGELSFYHKLYLRGGYTGFFERDTERGLTFGGGMRVNIPYSLMFVDLDYSFEDIGILQNSQKFSLAISF
jgi:hypothetical protein